MAGAVALIVNLRVDRERDSSSSVVVVFSNARDLFGWLLSWGVSSRTIVTKVKAALGTWLLSNPSM